MRIITGTEATFHVSSQQDADSNAALFGDGDYVLPIGGKFKHTVVSNNLITMLDGQVMIQGRKGSTDYGQTEKIIIENGTQGQCRNDLIVARYTKNSSTQIEDMKVEIVKGANGGNDPAINNATVIRGGALIHDMPLLRVRLDGISISGVDVLFAVLYQNCAAFALTVRASSWSSALAALTDTRILSHDVMDVDVDVSAAASAAQIKAWQDGVIYVTAQAAGSVTLRAYGTSPTIDIPVIVKLTRYGSAA